MRVYTSSLLRQMRVLTARNHMLPCLRRHSLRRETRANKHVFLIVASALWALQLLYSSADAISGLITTPHMFIRIFVYIFAALLMRLHGNGSRVYGRPKLRPSTTKALQSCPPTSLYRLRACVSLAVIKVHEYKPTVLAASLYACTI